MIVSFNQLNTTSSPIKQNMDKQWKVHKQQQHLFIANDNEDK
jgi:hypothetical protein